MKNLKSLWIALLIITILAACSPSAEVPVDKEYVLTAAMQDGQFAFIGVNGNIRGAVNPVLRAEPGERITVMLVNGGWGTHDIVLPDLNIHSDKIKEQGETTSITFTVPNEDIAIEYHDTKYERLGMQGILLVGNAQAEMQKTTANFQPAAVEPTGPVVEYTLESNIVDGKMVFIGKGGGIDGQVNPALKADIGNMVKVTLFSGDGAGHNFYLDEFGAKSADVSGLGNSISVEFIVDKDGTFSYYCNIPGHRQAGMEGKFIAGSGVASMEGMSQNNSYTGPGVSESAVVAAGAADPNAVDIIRDPSDLPAPLPNRGPEKVVINLETVEVAGKLADGTTYKYWTFNGAVPGPFLRIRVGDTVEVHLKNLPESVMAHSVDFHAVTGPGGGAVATQTMPGGETMFTFKAINPGLYVYHCATPMVAHHIANGMYGLILVEPEGGLPPVDREFYVMQGELYTAQPYGTKGALTEDVDKLLNENPEYFVFNGAAMGLTTEEHRLHANVGETVRIFFGVGGPNFTSSFHVIGEIFDRVYNQASLTSNPLTDVQTTLVPPGGATMVEFKLEVPGRYILVDHALSRLERGLAGFLMVEGDANPDIFDGTLTPGSGH
ncbi:MAG TPA: copper-containing nitrite reductase [Anaerolineales bacterium]|nr:copper-containing nitrite reductase [Anaerolineales bacterium]